MKSKENAKRFWVMVVPQLCSLMQFCIRHWLLNASIYSSQAGQKHYLPILTPWRHFCCWQGFTSSEQVAFLLSIMHLITQHPPSIILWKMHNSEKKLVIIYPVLSACYITLSFTTSWDMGILTLFLWIEETATQQVTQGSTSSKRKNQNDELGSDSKICSPSTLL